MAIDRLLQPVHSASVPAALLDIARSGRWLKVDAGPVYR
jgi:hypothetical protein